MVDCSKARGAVAGRPGAADIVEIGHKSPSNRRIGAIGRPWIFRQAPRIRFGWETFKKRPWFFVGRPFVLMTGPVWSRASARAVDARVHRRRVGSRASRRLGQFRACSTLISMGMTAFYLAAHDHPETAGSPRFGIRSPFWRYLGLTILFASYLAVFCSASRSLPSRPRTGPDGARYRRNRRDRSWRFSFGLPRDRP